MHRYCNISIAKDSLDCNKYMYFVVFQVHLCSACQLNRLSVAFMPTPELGDSDNRTQQVFLISKLCET